MTADLEPVGNKVGRLLMRAISITLAVGLLALGGAYVWQVTRDRGETRVVDKPDPTPIPDPQPLPPLEPTGPLWALETTAATPDADAARNLAAEADREWFAGRVDAAALKYQLAYHHDQSPELALKLG
jgi:hypothetical protein